ncbi:MAG TPA: homogentisate phytyltransferase [Baekduia sp.]|nr:homogentisate phytyltransferase [Baekduia sp.]
MSTSAAAPAVPALPLAVLWRFGRPHTLVGTTTSVLALAALALDGAVAGAGTVVLHVAGTLAAALAVNVAIVGVNQVEDVEIDRVNKPGLPIPAGELSLATARRVVAAAAAIAVALALTQGAVELAAVTFALAVGWAYSCPPVRLKRHPVAAAAAITVVRAGVVNLGVWWHLADALRAGDTAVAPGVWLLAALTVPFGVAIAVLKDVPDLEGDRRHGITTFTVRLGPRRALALGTGALALAGLGTAIALPLLLPAPVALPAAALHVAAVAWMARRARTTHDVPAFYQAVWRLFFAEYLLVPLAFLIG